MTYEKRKKLIHPDTLTQKEYNRPVLPHWAYAWMVCQTCDICWHFSSRMSTAANHSAGLTPSTNSRPHNIPVPPPPRPLPWKRVVDVGRGVRQVRPGGLSGSCSGNDTPGSGCTLITRFLDVQQEGENWVEVFFSVGLFCECYFVRERKCEFCGLKFKRIFFFFLD